MRVAFLGNAPWAVPSLEALAESPHAGPLLRVDIHNGGIEQEALEPLKARFGGRFSSRGRQTARVATMGNMGRLVGDED